MPQFRQHEADSCAQQRVFDVALAHVKRYARQPQALVHRVLRQFALARMEGQPLRYRLLPKQFKRTRGAMPHAHIVADCRPQLAFSRQRQHRSRAAKIHRRHIVPRRPREEGCHRLDAARCRHDAGIGHAGNALEALVMPLDVVVVTAEYCLHRFQRLTVALQDIRRDQDFDMLTQHLAHGRDQAIVARIQNRWPVAHRHQRRRLPRQR